MANGVPSLMAFCYTAIRKVYKEDRGMFAQDKEYTGSITIEERRRIEQWFVREYGLTGDDEARIKRLKELEVMLGVDSAYTADTPIESLELSSRLERWLKASDIYWVSDLEQMTWKDILKIRNIGELSAAELRQKLSENGIELSEE